MLVQERLQTALRGLLRTRYAVQTPDALTVSWKRRRTGIQCTAVIAVPAFAPVTADLILPEEDVSDLANGIATLRTDSMEQLHELAARMLDTLTTRIMLALFHSP